MDKKLRDFANDLYDVLSMNMELCTQDSFYNQYVANDVSFSIETKDNTASIYFDDFKITIERK